MASYDDSTFDWNKLLGNSGASGAMPSQDSGFKGTDWINLLAASLGGLKLYPRGYTGSQGQGLNIGAPLIGLAGVMQDRQNRERQASSIDQLKKLFPELEGIGGGGGMNVQDIMRLLPELSARRKETRQREAYGALKDIIAPMAGTPEPAETPITAARLLGGPAKPPPPPEVAAAMWDTGSAPPLSAAGEGPDFTSIFGADQGPMPPSQLPPPPPPPGPPPPPPPGRGPQGLDLFGARGAAGGIPLPPASQYQTTPTERPPTIGEQMKRINALKPEIAPYVSELLTPTFVQQQAQEIAERRKAGTEQVTRAKAAQPWVEMAVGMGAPREWATAHRAQFVAGTSKGLPELEGQVYAGRDGQFYRMPPWPGAKPIELSKPSEQPLPPEIDRSWKAFSAANPDKNFWDFKQVYIGLQHPHTERVNPRETDKDGRVRELLPNGTYRDWGLIGKPQIQPKGRGEWVRETLRPISITDKNQAGFQNAVDSIVGEASARGVLGDATSGAMVKNIKTGQLEPKTRVIERKWAQMNPDRRVQIVWNPQKTRFEVLRAYEVLETRQMNLDPEQPLIQAEE